MLPNGTQGIVLSNGIANGSHIWFQVMMNGYPTGWVAGTYLTKIGVVNPTATNTPGAGPSATSTATRTPTRTPTSAPGVFVPNDLVRTTANLNMRSAPGGSVLLVLPNGTQATVLTTGTVSGNFTWYRITAPGYGTGWVAGAYLEKIGVAGTTVTPPVSPPATSTSVGGWPAGTNVRTTTAVNMRIGPGTNNAIIGVVPSGTTCVVVDGPASGTGYTWYELTCPGTGTGWLASLYLRQIPGSSSEAESESVVAGIDMTVSPTATEISLETPAAPVETATTSPVALVEEEPAPVAEDSPAPYPVVRVQRTEGSSHGNVLVDEDLSTVWVTTGTEIPQIASFALDLDGELPVGEVRWLTGPENLMGLLLVHVSNDGQEWIEIDLDALTQDGDWSVVPLNTTTRFIRFVFLNEDQNVQLGGIAEVEVWPPEISQ